MKSREETFIITNSNARSFGLVLFVWLAERLLVIGNSVLKDLKYLDLFRN